MTDLSQEVNCLVQNSNQLSEDLRRINELKDSKIYEYDLEDGLPKQKAISNHRNSTKIEKVKMSSNSFSMHKIGNCLVIILGD